MKTTQQRLTPDGTAVIRKKGDDPTRVGRTCRRGASHSAGGSAEQTQRSRSSGQTYPTAQPSVPREMTAWAHGIRTGTRLSTGASSETAELRNDPHAHGRAEGQNVGHRAVQRHGH